ncbi:MAG: hypothetical protein C0616_14755 [Desulfuromonas sp.]|nr:MAG: hypothetical protein C0616_14755 [Desulfuromonas sp.]
MTDHSDKLFFRRQYLFGPEPYCPNACWKVQGFEQGFFLSAHEDVDSYVLSTSQRSLALIGFFVDPFHPEKSSAEILRGLLDNLSSAADLMERTAPLGGRWVLIYKDTDHFLVLNDPCGLRQVYFAGDDNNFWCGSQPEIIRQVFDLKRNVEPLLSSFVKSKGYGWQEGAWVGPGTIWLGCTHLLPNHYLCLRRMVVERFFPVEPLPQVAVPAAVDESARILKNSIEGMALRSPLMLPVTAGYDSRVLLAASRDSLDRVECYVDRMGIIEEDHPDVEIPRQLTASLGLNFSVLNSEERVPDWFLRLNRINVTRSRNLPKSRMIYARYKDPVAAININGNASEVCRNFFDKYLDLVEETLPASRLAEIFFGEGTDFATREIAAWLKELGDVDPMGYLVLDMLYWEQRMGNWGGHFPAEQDIALEEFSPFNNRRLMTLLLACPTAMRAAPDFELYRQLIQQMWPELLDYPFNPAYSEKLSLRQRIRTFLGGLRG